ncbi:hypothetical protein BH23GEM6_BH23GEM6_01970 [soil metagenome]
MPNRTCPSCLKRLPYAGRRCVHCGWTPQSGVDQDLRRASRRRQTLLAAIFMIFLVGGGSMLIRNAPALADWYAGFAAERLAQPFSSLAPVRSESGAYFYCARQVARQMDGDFSVETFPAPDESKTMALGAQRYLIVSYVDQARDDGNHVRHDFSCTVRYDKGRWVLEKLEMARYAGETVVASAQPF